ncbi:hypothetical protein CHS0354_021943 [Potamilus streckersoni]|uniref:Uncharacterized protein n=1 Tax=Potamilus streckersoni TaxID=2493646 RepID=A0AAE0VY02_9BIVA|nr:hypothetical protein CHS0354_021943 [Potamilus streckersoni]
MVMGMMQEQLYQVLHDGKPAILINADRSEEKLLLTYNIRPIAQRGNTSSRDPAASELLRMFHPAFETRNIPLSLETATICVHQLSILVSEHLHKLLKLMRAIEMVLNKTTYNENSDYNLHDLFSNNRIVSNAVVINLYSEMAHMYALCAAINMPIRHIICPNCIQRCPQNRTLESFRIEA